MTEKQGIEVTPEMLKAGVRLVVGPVPPDLQERREAAAAFVKALNQTQLDRLARELDLQTGECALIEILAAVSAAETTESLSRVNSRIFADRSDR